MAPFYQRRTIGEILTQGTGVYGHHWLSLTRPLFYPLGAQLIGVIFWIVLTFESVDLLTTYVPQLNVWALWFIFLLANLPGMYIFFHGFWRYIVWVTALNLLARDLVENGTSDHVDAFYLRVVSRSVDYSLIWSFLFAILFIPLGLAVIPLSISAANPDWYWGCVIAALLIILVGLVLGGILLIFFSLVFQVFAFTPGSAGASLFRSLDLVSVDIFKTLTILAIAVIATQFLLPSLVLVLCQALKLTQLLASGMEIGVSYILSKTTPSVLETQADYPFLATAYRMLAEKPALLAHEIIQTLLYTIVSALLLPLGTCWMALLYADLKTRLDEKSQA